MVWQFEGTERFELRGKLGAGGMGVVYEAYDREREVEVALKTLHSTDDPEALLRFKREFRSLADVSHENLISLYELIAEGEQWFFTMELLDAIDFVSWVRHETPPAPGERTRGSTSGPATAVTTPALESSGAPELRAPRRGGELDVDRLRGGLRGLVAGIAALHRSGHLHRDVKPSNVLVTGDGRVVLLDFGVITELSAAAGDAHGTPAYMAPEQAAGAAEPASDWYAVGAVIYEALTGRRPYEGSSSAILEAKRHWAPMRPRLEVSDVPADLDALCMRLLDRDPGRRPDGAEIIAVLSGQRRRRRRTTTDAGSVVLGRERELAELEEALAEIRAGRPIVVDVYGESGMGKTALVRHFCEKVGDGAGAEVAVLAGRCYENETVPHKAIDSVVDALADLLAAMSEDEQRRLVPDDAYDLARMFPVLRQVAAIAELADAGVEVRGDDLAEIRRRARDALRQLVGRLAAERPLVVFIDDLHWGDLESAPLIDAITRPPGAPPLMLVTTSRTSSRDRSPLLKALKRRRRRLGPALPVREIEVGVLEPDAAAALARRLLPDGGAGAAAQIVDESGGNPYLIGELVRFAGRERAGAATLDTMIGGRVERLSDAEARLLSVLSIAGRPLLQTVARAAASIERPDWHALIHQLRQAQLVRVSGFSDDDTVEPYHDRIRETVARSLGDRAAEHHRRLAESLESTGTGEAHELARHYAAAGDRERAAAQAVAAAELADETLAFDQAAALWQLAIDCGGPEPAWLEARATALVNAGRGHDAGDAFITAAGRREGLERLGLLRVAAEQYLRSGYIDRGLEVLGEVLGEVGVKLPETARAAVPSFLWYRLRLLLRGFGHRRRDAGDIAPEALVELDIYHTACIGLALIDMGRAAAFAQRNLVRALAAGEPGRLAYALSIAAGFNAGSGSARLTRTMLELAETIAGDVDDPLVSAFVEIVRAIDHYERGDFATYQSIAEATEERLRSQCRGVAWELRTTQLMSCTSLFFLGRLDELREKVPEWLSSATDRGDLYATTNIHALAMPIVLLAGGDVAGARAEIRQVDETWSYSGFTMQRLFRYYSSTVIELYEGEVDAAWKIVSEGDPAVRRSLVLRDRAVGNYWRFMRSTTAAATGDRTLHRRIRRDARYLLADSAPCYQAMGEVLRAAVCAGRDDPAGAIAHLERAVSEFDRAGFALYAGCARMHLGRLKGGDQGAAIRQEGYDEVASRCAVPERIARALVCGFGETA